jgi:hypothetical protein
VLPATYRREERQEVHLVRYQQPSYRTEVFQLRKRIQGSSTPRHVCTQSSSFQTAWDIGT